MVSSTHQLPGKGLPPEPDVFSSLEMSFQVHKPYIMSFHTGTQDDTCHSKKNPTCVWIVSLNMQHKLLCLLYPLSSHPQPQPQPGK